MKDIIISAKNGDPEAFGRLYESCRKAGISLAKQYVKNDTDAEDIYQDAFLKAMENIDRFDENREFGPWLNTIIANTCKDFLGKKRPMNFTDMSDEENEFVDTIASSDESSLPESMYVRKEMLQIVDGIVEMLPDEQKEATLLFYFKNYSIKQVAEYQHVSEDTVKSRLNYSRKKVEQATKDYEKKHGIKICAYSVIPAILVLYFKNSVYASQLDASLGALSASNGLSGAAIKAGTAAKTAAAAKTIAAWKIAAIAGAGIIAVTGVGFAIHHFVATGDRDDIVAEYGENTSEESEIQTVADIDETEPQEEAVINEETEIRVEPEASETPDDQVVAEDSDNQENPEDQEDSEIQAESVIQEQSDQETPSGPKHFDIDITYSGVPGPEGTVGAVNFGNFSLNLEGNPNVVGTPSGWTVHMYDPTNVNKTYEFNILIPVSDENTNQTFGFTLICPENAEYNFKTASFTDWDNFQYNNGCVTGTLQAVSGQVIDGSSIWISFEVTFN